MGLIEIDGAYREGGGQIVRTALVFSLLTSKPIRVFNIRKGRQKPGLKPQHLHVLQALTKLTDSRVEGAHLGSLEIIFYPGKIIGGRYEIDFKTAGAITLFLQTILPVSLFARNPVHLRIKGGTDVPMAMTWDYFQHIVLPYYKGFAHEIHARCVRRGYYPPGGGEVELKVVPRFEQSDWATLCDKIRATLSRLELVDRPQSYRLKVTIQSSSRLQARHVRDRIQRTMSKLLMDKGVNPTFEGSYWDTLSPGCSVTMILDYGDYVTGVDKLCAPGLPAEEVAKHVVDEFIQFIRSPEVIDPHLQDNIIPVLALRGGRVKIVKPSSHTLTNIWVVERFLGGLFKWSGNILVA